MRYVNLKLCIESREGKENFSLHSLGLTIPKLKIDSRNVYICESDMHEKCRISVVYDGHFLGICESDMTRIWSWQTF